MKIQKVINLNELTPPTFWDKTRLEPMLFVTLIALAALGICILYSASNSQMAMVMRQATRLLISFIIMIFFAQIPPHKYEVWAPWMYVIGIFLLLSVLLFGKTGKGAQRWLDLGFVRFQPSEIMKVIVPMMLAWFFSLHPPPIKAKSLIISVIIIMLPAILIIKQPDLGTGLMVMFSGCVVLFVAGLSYRIIAALLAFASLAAPFLWQHLHDYQKQRVLTFLNPERDPLGNGYHIIQSKIAIGSGGLLGKGFLNGSQSHLHFLPEHATDFIFAVIGEEFGLLGCLILIILFLMIIFRSLHIANLAPSRFTRLLTVSLTMNFFLSAFINMGMVTGILPVVGIPLPLISYGGSSLIVIFASFGILMSIYSERALFNASR